MKASPFYTLIFRFSQCCLYRFLLYTSKFPKQKNLSALDKTLERRFQKITFKRKRNLQDDI